MPSKHILLLSLGPIQEFISSARRCQDLWFGSWLLADLSRCVAAAVDDAAGGGALVFPAGLDLGFNAPVANKILARLPGSGVRAAAEAGRSALQARLHLIRDDAFRRLRDGDIDRPCAEAQIEAMLELCWVSVPEAPTYQAARSLAERLLAERKNTRDWGPVTWGEGVAKCTVCGQRESVLDERRIKAGVVASAEYLSALKCRSKERLCGVCLLKRLGEDLEADTWRLRRPDFHSTSHVAAGPLLVRACVRAPDLGPLADTLDLARFSVGSAPTVTLTNPLDRTEHRTVRLAFGVEPAAVDGSVLYPNRTADHFEGAGVPGKTVAEADTAVRSALRQLGVSEPNAYYALLLADGDRVGAALDEAGRSGFTAQSRVARGLDAFSLGCSRLVRDHAGSLIYAGGDDVLALLPLHTVLDCARALRCAFTEAVRDACTGLAAQPTFSIGIAIAHHQQPLDEVRGLARRAEGLAKRGADGAGLRDALAILMEKRAGGVVTAVGRWDDDGGPDGRLVKWVQLLRADSLPDGIAWELETLSDELAFGGAEPEPELVRALGRRALRRKRGEHGGELLSDDVLQAVLRRLDPGTTESLRAVASEIQIARLLLGALEQAWGVA